MKKLLSLLFSFFCPRLEFVFFESSPDFEGSPRMIYDELKKRGYDEKYKLVWLVDKKNVCNDFPCMAYFGNLNFREKILKEIRLNQARIIVDSNRAVFKKNPKTIRLYTRHGGPLKRVPRYTRSLGKIDYTLATSDITKTLDFIDYKGYCCENLNQVLPLGFPIDDKLFEKNELVHKGFYQQHLKDKNIVFDKVIGWLPTLRQHKIGNRVDSSVVFPFGIPLVRTRDSLIQLNAFLNEKKILLAIQTHHAQLANFSIEDFSNIIFISSEIKRNMNVSFAEMLSSFDALITDYSSVYYEYLLLDRPIALSIDDFEDYTSKTELYVEYFDWIKGDYLKKMDDLFIFIDNLSKNIDKSKSNRQISLHRVHKYIDNQSTERVVDFLIEKVFL